MATIMLVSTASSIGGMERIVCGLARGLVDRGARVRTFFPRSDHDDELMAWCADQGVDAETHPAVLDAAAPHSVRTAASLAQLVDDVDPDVVNLHYGDNFLSLWDVLGVRRAGLRRPVVASIHHPTAWTPESRRKRRMTAAGARLTSRITTFASATRDVLLQAGVPSRQMEIIPCGVQIPASRIDRADARRALGLRDDTYVVGTLARLVDYKGIDRLIDAMNCEDLAGAVLLVGGEGPERDALERRAAAGEYLDARFLGRVPEVGDVFAACDVFALPSRLEGFGLVYVEAAMYGVPSIATRVGGVPDAVRHDETGVLIDPDDDEALRAALVDLAEDPRRRSELGASARQRAEHELDEDTMVDRFEALFAGLVRHRAGAPTPQRRTNVPGKSDWTT